jgi:hypothetical protein
MRIPDAARLEIARRVRAANAAMFPQLSRFVRKERIGSRIGIDSRVKIFR